MLVKDYINIQRINDKDYTHYSKWDKYYYKN